MYHGNTVIILMLCICLMCHSNDSDVIEEGAFLIVIDGFLQTDPQLYAILTCTAYGDPPPSVEWAILSEGIHNWTLSNLTINNDPTMVISMFEVCNDTIPDYFAVTCTAMNNANATVDLLGHSIAVFEIRQKSFVHISIGEQANLLSTHTSEAGDGTTTNKIEDDMTTIEIENENVTSTQPTLQVITGQINAGVILGVVVACIATIIFICLSSMVACVLLSVKRKSRSVSNMSQDMFATNPLHNQEGHYVLSNGRGRIPKKTPVTYRYASSNLQSNHSPTQAQDNPEYINLPTILNNSISNRQEYNDSLETNIAYEQTSRVSNTENKEIKVTRNISYREPDVVKNAAYGKLESVYENEEQDDETMTYESVN